MNKTPKKQGLTPDNTLLWDLLFMVGLTVSLLLIAFNFSD
jgi:hypothetical protein